MKVIIATGGTGGHIFCAMAIAEQLEKIGAKILVIASKYGLANQLIPKNYKIKFIYQKPLLGGSIFRKIAFPLSLNISLIQSFFIILKERPKAVIGTGGFGSFPPVLAAWITTKVAPMTIYTLITEVDSIPGLATKILAKFVDEIYIAFENAKNYLPTKKVKVVGFPIREAITRSQQRKELFTLDDTKPIILIIGGSQGARGINKLMEKTIPLLPEYQFIWQTGENESHRITQNNTENVVKLKFIENMGEAYDLAKIVIARAGALTIGEIIEKEKPSILIPYPYAAKNHQMINAKILEKKKATKVIMEKETTPEKLAYEIKNIIEHKCEEMRVAIKKLKKENAAIKIAKKVQCLGI